MSRHFVSHSSQPLRCLSITGSIHRWRLISAFVQLVTCICLCTVAQGEESLEKAIRHVVHQSHFKHAHWGALFVDRKSGEVIFEHAPQKLFAPASTTKLYSVACALDALGADFRFRTPVVRHGEVHEHVLTEFSGRHVNAARGRRRMPPAYCSSTCSGTSRILDTSLRVRSWPTATRWCGTDVWPGRAP